MSLLLLLRGGGEGPPASSGSIAITRESPPDTMEFIVRDGPEGPPVSRWAEDAVRDEDVLSSIRLRGQVPGGRKEAVGTLPRDPRQPSPDTRAWRDVDVQGAGRELLWSGRFAKAPQHDGDYIAIDGVCEGWQKAFSDRKGVRVGLIDPALGRIGGITAQRRANLLAEGSDPDAATSTVDQFGSGSEGNRPAGISFTFSEFTSSYAERGELLYDSGGIDIGAVYYDFQGWGDPNADWLTRVDLSLDGVVTLVAGTDHDGASASSQVVSAGGLAGLRYACFKTVYVGPFTGPSANFYRFAHIYVLGNHGLVPVGTWPDIGLTKKQIFPWLIPQIAPALEVSHDTIDDDGFVIQDAWYPDAQEGTDIVHDLMKTSVLDWFVKTRRLFEVRVPGTYGRRWKATIANSGFQEDGFDPDRSWRSIKGSYTDEAGITRYVGPPGSGCDFESPLLEITDPNHPAVQAGIPREDLLQLQKLSTPQRAIEACAEWLQHANELPRSGRAVLRDHVMDEFTVMRPVSQVAEGDPIQFTDARDNSYRKIVEYDYDRGERACTVAVDAPSDALQALNERYGAALVRLGV